MCGFFFGRRRRRCHCWRQYRKSLRSKSEMAKICNWHSGIRRDCTKASWYVDVVLVLSVVHANFSLVERKKSRRTLEILSTWHLLTHRAWTIYFIVRSNCALFSPNVHSIDFSWWIFCFFFLSNLTSIHHHDIEFATWIELC